MNVKIRRAEVADIPWLISQLQAFSEFFNSKIQLFGDADYAESKLKEMIAHHYVIIADVADAGPVGFIGALQTPHFFNPNIRMLSEMFWWVDPEWRGTRAGLMLLKEFVEWGKQNADWITMSLEHHSPVKDETILKRGFKFQERSFLMEVN